MKVRLFRPLIGDDEITAIKETFEASWVGLGNKVSEFEGAWCSITGAENALAVNSGTAALHLAVKAFSFTPGSEILVPSLTFSSTAFAAVYEGLKPVFVDIDNDTLCMDLDDLSSKITPKTAAVIIVHFGGNHTDINRLKDLCDQHKIKLIEDCAHSQYGRTKEGDTLGLIGDVGCYSFEEKKGITTGDGGMIVSADAELINKLKPARWVGIDKDTWVREQEQRISKHWYYEINDIGYKYNMNNLSAAIGLAQLKKLDQFNKRKRDIIARYQSQLTRNSFFFDYDTKGNLAYWLFGIRSARRDELIIHCQNKGIATGVHYTPLNQHNAFKNFRGKTPVANKFYDQAVTLPLHPALNDGEIDYVCETVNNFEQTL